jgi:hypothetical protein
LQTVSEDEGDQQRRQRQRSDGYGAGAQERTGVRRLGNDPRAIRDKKWCRHRRG